MPSSLVLAKGDRLFDGVNHPSAATLLADGLKGGLLYCGTPTSGKDITAAQYLDYKAHSLWTILCYEHMTSDIIGGNAAGVAHAKDFLADCRTKNISFAEPALAAVDEHVALASLPTAVAYQAGFRTQLKAGGWTGLIGTYGFPEVLAAMHDAGVADFYFGAGSQSAQPPYVNIWQDNTATILVGGSADDQDWIKIPLPVGGIIVTAATPSPEFTVSNMTDDGKAHLARLMMVSQNVATVGATGWGYVPDKVKAEKNGLKAALDSLAADVANAASKADLAALSAKLDGLATTGGGLTLDQIKQAIAQELATVKVTAG